MVFEPSGYSGDHQLEPFSQECVSPPESVITVTSAPPPFGEMIARSIPTLRKVLPCEFVGWAACNVSFELKEFQKWVDHIVEEHLHLKYPKRCICWFCDDVEFITNESTGTESCQRNFRDRMLHIHGHFTKNDVSLWDIRPDFFFMDHLYNNHLIGKEVYEVGRNFSEGPRVKGIHPPHFVPLEILRKQEKISGIIVDTGREDRNRRRLERSRSSRVSWLGTQSEVPSRKATNKLILSAACNSIYGQRFMSKRSVSPLEM